MASPLFQSLLTAGEDVDLFECTDPHVIAGLLKLYLRELPDPLLTHKRYDAFISCLSVPDSPQRVQVGVCVLV